MTLDELREGQRARVIGVRGDDALAVRLMEMGLIEGQDVTMVGAAPLGDPIEYELPGYRLSLRRSEARRIEVEPI